MGLDKERKPIPKWVHFCFWSGVTLFAFYVLFLICNQLWILSHQQNWSGEVNAAIINTFISAITLAVTIGVTVYFNLQTQKITIEQNQKNLELQMELHKQNLEMQERINQQNMEFQKKIQEMNYEAMMHQSRSTMRDYVYQEKIKAYRVIIDKIAKLRAAIGTPQDGSIDMVNAGLNNEIVPEEKLKEINSLHDDLYNTIDQYKFFCSKSLLEILLIVRFPLSFVCSKNPPAPDFTLISYQTLDDIIRMMYEELSIKKIEEDISDLNTNYIRYSQTLLNEVKEKLFNDNNYYRKRILAEAYMKQQNKQKRE